MTAAAVLWVALSLLLNFNKLSASLQTLPVSALAASRLQSYQPHMQTADSLPSPQAPGAPRRASGVCMGGGAVAGASWPGRHRSCCPHSRRCWAVPRACHLPPRSLLLLLLLLPLLLLLKATRTSCLSRVMQGQPRPSAASPPPARGSSRPASGGAPRRAAASLPATSGCGRGPGSGSIALTSEWAVRW